MTMKMKKINEWKPLETVMEKRGNIYECSMFMYMGTKDDRYHLYKHVNTRRYLTIDDDCNFYIGYNNKVTEQEAFDYVLS